MKETILDAAEKMVQDRGLNAVSFRDLAEAVGLSKATIFHHFENKEALTRALIERCSQNHAPRYQAVVEAEASAPEKLRQLARIFEIGCKEQRPCLMASIGMGRSSLPESVADELASVAKHAARRFELVFAEGRDEGTLAFEGKPIDAAIGFLAMLQGLQAFLRSSGGTASSFRRSASVYIESLTS